MYFPISGVHLDPIYLVLIGFVIGVLGGFFGVGGSFLTAPALFAAGLPMNYVVGTDLAHIVGKSIVAARTHRVLGNIDMKLAAIMVIGTIGGSEAGVQAIEVLKKGSHVELVVGTVRSLSWIPCALVAFFSFRKELLGLFIRGESIATARKYRNLSELLGVGNFRSGTLSLVTVDRRVHIKGIKKNRNFNGFGRDVSYVCRQR